MAKKKKNKGNGKALKNVSAKDLRNRELKRIRQIEKLKEKKKGATSPEEKQRIQTQIDRKVESRKKINKALKNKTSIPKPKTEEELLAEIYASPKFQGLSDANKEMAKAVLETYTPEQLRNVRITKKEAQNIVKKARSKAKKERNYDLKQLDMDAEQVLRADTESLRRYIDEQEAMLAKEQESGVFNDRRIIAIRDLKNSLSDAEDKYAVAAEAKNQILQESLKRAEDDLSTARKRADEDAMLTARQNIREYNRSLRATQQNMAARGLAFSGIRAREENELEEEYEDYMTTAQLKRSRDISDAAEKSRRDAFDAKTLYQSDMRTLMDTYGNQEVLAIQSAEKELGTGAVQDIIGEGTGVAGEYSKHLYEDLSGGLQQDIQAREDLTQQNIRGQAEAYERLYGSNAAQEQFGGLYTPIGGLTGTNVVEQQRQEKGIRETYRTNVKAGVQAERQAKFLGKL